MVFDSEKTRQRKPDSDQSQKIVADSVLGHGSNTFQGELRLWKVTAGDWNSPKRINWNLLKAKAQLYHYARRRFQPAGRNHRLAVNPLIPETSDFLALFHRLCGGLGGWRDGWQNGADLHQLRLGLFLEHMLAVELHHTLLLLPVLQLGVARAGQIGR